MRRWWFLAMPEPHVPVALRPRRCACGAPVLLDLDGTVLDHRTLDPHQCKEKAA